MKTWLIIISVVGVLLAISVGVGFWMLTDAKAELARTKSELTEVREEQEQEKEPPWSGYAQQEQENTGYWWEDYSSHDGQDLGETVQVLKLRVDELEWTVRGLESQVQQLRNALNVHGIWP